MVIVPSQMSLRRYAVFSPETKLPKGILMNFSEGLICKKCQKAISKFPMLWRNCLYCNESTILGKVVSIAELKEELPLSHKGFLNISGAYCQKKSSLQLRMTHKGALGYGEVTYLAGTKLAPKLHFIVTRPSDEITIQHYEPGNWEEKIDLAYKEVERIKYASEKIIEAVKKQDEKLYHEILDELLKSPIGSALLQKYEDGYRTAKKDKIRCPVCGTKIDERCFLVPLTTIYCPQCGMFIKW